VTPAGHILRGWDNAPHHPEVETYPHHVHGRDGVYPSVVRTLAGVLDLLEAELFSGPSGR
jgi:hypothetical protein